jgi:integrase
MSVHKNPEGRWFCKWYEGGREKRKYFGFDSIARVAAQRHDEKIKRDKGKIPTVPGGLTVAEVLQHYHTHHPVETSTAKMDYYKITRIILPIMGAIHAEALTSVELNRYVALRLEAGKKRSTIVRDLGLLRAAMNWAQTQDPPLIFHNAVRNFRIQQGRSAEVPIPPGRGEIDRLIKASPPHLLRAILISWCCGLRPGGEVARLRWSDYSRESKELRVVSAKKGRAAVRFIPLTQDLSMVLDLWLESDSKGADEDQDVEQLPIVNYRGRPVDSLKTAWARAKKQAGITRRLRPYDLRHAWFTQALQLGGDIKAISELGGHSRVDTTLRFYDHVTQQRHRTAMEKIQGVAADTILSLLSSDTVSDQPPSTNNNKPKPSQG